MINIIGGNKRGIKIEVPNFNVRPTSSMKREAIFSILESNFKKKSLELYNKYFLDLFSGSGSLGLEAISRGAKFCYFCEIQKNVVDILKTNCDKICTDKNFKIIKENATNFDLKKIEHPVSIIFIDPPYDLNPFYNLLKRLLENEIILKKAVIVIETSKKTVLKVPSILKIFDYRIYGKTKIYFLSY